MSNTVAFPLSKDIVELLIKVYSKKSECGRCNDKFNDVTEKCCVCKKEWNTHHNCSGDEFSTYAECENCAQMICKECMSKCDRKNGYNIRLKEGIRIQVHCEYDLEKKKYAKPDHILHQPNHGFLLCQPCADAVPKCEKCDQTLYLCNKNSRKGCANNSAKKEQLLRWHNEFSCPKK